MTIDRLMRACQILDSYKEDGVDSEDVCTEHDQILLGGPRPGHLQTEHVKELADLGFRYDVANDSWVGFT